MKTLQLNWTSVHITLVSKLKTFVNNTGRKTVTKLSSFSGANSHSHHSVKLYTTVNLSFISCCEKPRAGNCFPEPSRGHQETLKIPKYNNSMTWPHFNWDDSLITSLHNHNNLQVIRRSHRPSVVCLPYIPKQHNHLRLSVTLLLFFY